MEAKPHTAPNGGEYIEMTAKCTVCGYDWNVSPFQRIPQTGYICPACHGRMKRGETSADIKEAPKEHIKIWKGVTR